MIDFIIFLLEVTGVYILFFMFFSALKSSGEFFDRLIFCQACATFFTIFITLFIYYIYTGIEIIDIPFLAGLSFSGIAYKLYSVQDRNKKQKQKVEEEYDRPYPSFVKEFFYTTRLFVWEIIFLNAGLILIKVGGLN